MPERDVPDAGASGYADVIRPTGVIRPAGGAAPPEASGPSARGRHRPALPPAPSGKRRDIQGLRMLAVVGVFVNHVSDHPIGAFTGVDVFFVISGFLITGLLVRDAAAGSTVPGFFGSFYERRARRILPAALVVLAASWVAAGLTFKGPRVGDAHTDILWSLGFAANIHFANLGTDYFHLTQSPSITQHFWSLAVEEQFYLVWPVVVLAVLAVVGRRLARSLRVLLGVLSVLTVLSFGYAVHDTAHSPATAYFSTFARAWELGIGAVLAVTLAIAPRLPGMFGRARGPLMLLGFALILLGFFVVDPGRRFPAPGAALPVLATALVILVGPAENAWTWPLTNRLSQYLGEISYSLYLWHWPTIVILSALMPDRTALYYAIVVAAASGLSILSYEFVETPLRTRRRAPGREQAARRTSARRTGRPRRVGALLACLLVAAAVVGFEVRPAAPDPHFVGGSDARVVRLGASVAQPSAALRASILSALQATSFPSFRPGLSTLTDSTEKRDWVGCNTDTTVLATCEFPSASFRAAPGKTAMLIGDSMALAFMPAVKKALLPHGWKVVVVARQQCTAAYVSWTPRTSTPEASSGCDRFHAFLPTAVAQVQPDLVLLTSTVEILGNLRSGATGAAADAEYSQGMAKTHRIVDAPGRQVVTVSPPPGSKALAGCDSAAATPASCVTAVGTDWRRQSVDDKAVASRTSTGYLDDSLWFCSNSGFCPAFVGTTPVFYDGRHLTKSYSESLGPLLSNVLGG